MSIDPTPAPAARPGLTVRELMTPADRLATVAPETTLREVAALFAAKRVRGAPVLAGSQVAGVVSASDLLDFAAAAPDAVAAEFDPAEWGEEEQEHEWDGARAAAAASFLELWMDAEQDVGQLLAAQSPEWNAFDEHTAAEVMTRRLLTVRPGASVRHAARAMMRAGVHRLLVVEEGELLGLVSMTDVVRAVAEGRLVPA